MSIIGKKEAEEGRITLRRHGVGDLGVMGFDEAMIKIKEEL